MAIWGWLPLLVATLGLAQEAAPFPAETHKPWLPAWELSLRNDRVSGLEYRQDDLHRTDLQLRLRWSAEWDGLRVVGGIRSALGSDGNKYNVVRFDQEPSNGTQLDLARVDLTRVSPALFGCASLGFQENRLVTSQAMWDPDLRFLGGALSAGARSVDGSVQEAGVRLEAGRVRNIQGMDMDLVAGQLVLKFDTGWVTWTLHADRWNLAWKEGQERLEAVAGHESDARQRLDLVSWGAGMKLCGPAPVELRWFHSRNRGAREDSEEFQVSVGSRERPWWPQAMYTWQRLSPASVLYPVNGDAWWLFQNARGPRYELALPLPGQWLVSVAYMRQEEFGGEYLVRRRTLQVVKRF